MKEKISSKVNTDGSVMCGNCGQSIPPGTDVSILEANDGFIVCHSSISCSAPGNARYGYWGNGTLASVFRKIEQC